MSVPIFIRVCLTFLAVIAFASESALQELPPVIAFAPEDYRADNQNWSIAQDEANHIFIANNKGLLEYNSDSWQLYASPNESIIRSVYVHGNIVYSGCFRDFGYWKRDKTGQLNYHSLVENADFDIGANEEFWTILSHDQWLVFQSLDAIYIFNTTEGGIEKIEAENGITKLFKAGGDIYFSVPRKGIYKILNGRSVLVSDHRVFRDHLVLNLYELEGQLLVQTNVAGIYTLGDNPESWGGENAAFIRSLAVYNSFQTRSGNIVLGTISEGVVKVNSQGGIEYHITKKESLSNNTVLSLFEDRAGNIWLGLDNGINCINQNSAIGIFYDKSGELGTVYASAVFQDRLYLGTNQGLFYRNLNSQKNESFQLIPGSVGRVWDLFVYDGRLFCAHNEGSFLVENNRWIQVSDIPGTWCFRPVPGFTDMLIKGNYTGLSILEKTKGRWQLRNTLEGFIISSRFIEFIDPTTLLVDHEYKGV